MDSRELYQIISPFDRERADTLMWAILGWVGQAVPAERVYSAEQLAAWALRSGWRQHDDAELCALLKSTQEYVPAFTPLSTSISDALAARRAIV